MSYNIMKKRAGFAGSTEGTIENIVDTHSDQTINGQKTITNLTASAFSSSATVYAAAFVGDGSGLDGISAGAVGQGPVESIQFHTGSGGLSGSANLSFLTSSNTLEVTGDISASINISASSFYGDGSNLSNIGAANISGQLSPTQIAHSSPLTNSAGNLTVKTDTSRVIGSTANGIGLDTSTLTPQAGVNDSYYLIATDGSNNYNTIQFSTIESTLNIGGGNITGSNSINNAVLPANISVTSVTASSGFSGDGSNLSNIAAGSTNQIQFHGPTVGDLAASSDLTFNDTTDTLTTKTGSFEAVSASTAQFGEITSNLIPETTNTYYLGSPDLSKRWVSVNSVNSNVSGLAVSVTGAIQHALGIGTLNPSYELDVTGTIAVNGQISASSYVSASSFAFADSIKIAGAPSGQDTVIDSNGNFYGDTIDVGTVSASNIVVTDGLGGVEYKFPVSDGSSGQALTTDGAGNLTFASVGGGSTVEDHWRTSTFFINNQTAYYIPVNADPNARNQLNTISGIRWGGIHYNAPASGSLKRIRMVTVIGDSYVEPAKYDVILCLAKNDTNAAANDASTSPYGHITASANTYVVASGSIGLIWDIPITNNSEWSGSNVFDPGDILKMTNRYATAQSPGQNYDAALTITFELSGSDV